MFLCSSKKYLSETISRNVPPKAEIAVFAPSSRWAYFSGEKKASLATAIGERATLAATITIGKMRRVPTTAIRIPHVRKRFCHVLFMRISTLAFTTALSKESVISRTINIAARRNVLKPNQE